MSELLPPPVHEIIKHPERVRQRYPLFEHKRYRVSRISPPSQHLTPTDVQTNSNWLARIFPFSRSSQPKALPALPDTPSAALYRMYEFLVADWTTQFRNELEYFCCRQPSWAIADIPDPADYADPARYAVLAVLTKLMCAAFNRRVDFGLPRDAPAIIEDFTEVAARPKVYEQPPEWAMRVQPLKETLFVPDEMGRVMDVRDEEVGVEFRKMNIIIREPHIHFI